jgi:hypothetical protein
MTVVLRTQLTLHGLNLFVFFLLLLAGACSDPRGRDLRPYYFPLRELTEGRVYELEPLGATPPAPVYWYYRSFVSDSALVLTANAYGTDFIPDQLIRERYTPEGMITEEVILYEPDSLGTQLAATATVEAGNAFPFFLAEDRRPVYLYRIRFRLPSQPAVEQVLVLNRQFAKDTLFDFRGESIEAIQFTLKGLVEVRDTVQGGIDPEFSGYELYARGLGLVESRRAFGPGAELHYRLRDTLSMDRLEALARRSLGRE